VVVNTRTARAAFFTGALAVGWWALYMLRSNESKLRPVSPQTNETYDYSTDTGNQVVGSGEPDNRLRPIGDAVEEGQSIAPANVPPTTPPEILRVLEEYRQAPLPGTDSRHFSSVQQRILENDTAFSAEALDTMWAQGVEWEIVHEIAQIKGHELVMLQVECRTTTCRVQLAQRVPASEPLDRPSPSVRAFREELDARLDLDPRGWTLSVDRYGAAHSVTYFQRRDAAQRNALVQ
jgi:hypothetical protein